MEQITIEVGPLEAAHLSWPQPRAAGKNDPGTQSMSLCGSKERGQLAL